MTSPQKDIGILTVITAELEATLAVLGLRPEARIKTQEGTNYWFGHIESQLRNRDYSVVLGIIGSAGNYGAAVAATSLIKEFSPRILLLVGISAGIRGKIKIGEVVLSERVVAYESAALELKEGKESVIPRPDMPRISHPVEQDIMSYMPNERDLLTVFSNIGGAFPKPTADQEEEFRKNVAITITAKVATVASGEKLLKNPNILKTLRSDTHGRIEVGEMEAAGLAAACRLFGTNWLVVRGVSDFGDELKSDEFHKFAARTAAVVLADFIRKGLDIDYAGATPPSDTQQQNYPHLSDLLVQLSELIHPASAESQFHLRIFLANSYEDILSSRLSEPALTPKQFLEHVELRRILIHAPGGSGKTAVMCEIAQEALANGQIVFFLDLKTGSSADDLPEDLAIEHLFDAFSVAGTIADFNRALERQEETLLLVDGLNEVYGPLSETILKITERLLRSNSKLKVIAADRLNSHQDVRFKRATIAPLDQTEVKRLLPGGTNLPEEQAERQLLSVPFFLDLQLSLWSNQKSTDVSPQSVLARREMFMRYFIEVAKVSEEALPGLAKAAYTAYEKYQGRTFENQWWITNTPDGVARQLDEAGITVETIVATGERKKMFRHQLLHDFLTGYYVAGLGKEGWGSKVFDAATFKANAAEPISFAAEILNTDADDFLVQVYDWSYRVVDRCIIDLKHSLVRSPVSKDMEISLAVKNAEKLFDVFEYTALDSRRSLLNSSIPEAQELLSAKSMADVLSFVQGFSPSTPRFVDWKELFILPPNTRIKDEQMLLLDEDPIIGWTAANTFRRTSLSEANVAQARIMYFGAIKTIGETLRWRIVHLLGKYPSEETIALLLKATVSDSYEWARYGAIRSLMEIASQSNDHTREEIISALRSNLPNIKSPLIIREIRKTCLVCGAGTDWYEAIRSLAVEASGMPEAEAEREAWQELLEEIDRRRTQPSEEE